MEKKVSERAHVGGGVMRILERGQGVFTIDPVSLTPFWSLVQPSAEEARRYADKRLIAEGHDCAQLGCGPWVDISN